jgi:hypothetical protein
MISIYSSAFNLVKNNFNIRFHIDNFCAFADEVVIAVNSSTDETLAVMTDLAKVYSHLKILSTDFSYTDPVLDGKIKNHALQATSMPCKLGLDMDEYIPLQQKQLWHHLAQTLGTSAHQCYMIPSVNLYKDRDHFFSITPKWYLHKTGLFRGPVNYAYKEDGYIDTSKSDTCELIDAQGNLVFSAMTPSTIGELRSGLYPFVVHTGYMSLDNRLIRNLSFWKHHWLVESGGVEPKHKVHETLEDFSETYEKHMLNIGEYV